MPFYQILPEQNLPVKFLTYFSEIPLDAGQIVQIPIKNKIRLGLVVAEARKEYITDERKIKSVSKLLKVKFSQAQINFLFAFAYNTFNTPNNVLATMLNPIEMLTQKYWQQIITNNDTKNTSENQEKNNQKIDNYLETSKQPEKSFNKPKIEITQDDILFRIMYIIRSQLQESPQKPILIIFPEKKQLFSVVDQILPDLKNFKVNIYTAEKNSFSQQTVTNIITNQAEIVFTTRHGLFLPWQTAPNVILVDESNSLYIQDQNQLYYDTRDACFIFSQHFVTNLTFITTLPSVRLHIFNSNEFFEQIMTNTSNQTKKPLKIKLLKRNFKRDNFFDLLEMLEHNLYESQIFSDEDNMSI